MARRKPKVLITGAAGFGGRYLAEHLRREGCRVVGLDHPAVLRTLRKSGGGKDIVPLDLTRLSPGKLEKAIGKEKLAAVYHLAAIASVHRSWGSLRETLEVNAGGTTNLMESLRGYGRPPVLLVGSADQYGEVPPRRQPLKEDLPGNPRSPYALSKLWQESLGLYCFRLEGWPVYLTRTFNHTGPRQSPSFVCSDFARQVALIEAGRQKPVISVGNLSAVRDFLDVRDVVRAYHLLLEKGKPGIPYNVSSGKKWRIAAILDLLLRLATVKIRVEKDPLRTRPADIPLQCGDPGRLRRATGWRPRYRLEETLENLLEHWRGEVGGGKRKDGKRK